MTVQQNLRHRQLGLRQDTHASPIRRGHHAQAFSEQLAGDLGLAKRLAPSGELQAHAGPIRALSWSESGTHLVSGGEDCKVKIWDSVSSRDLSSLSLGHTGDIYDVAFMPHSSQKQIISCSSDTQVRLTDLNRNAVKPFNLHAGKVRTVVPTDLHTFLTGGEDGFVRQTDNRAPSTSLSPSSSQPNAGPMHGAVRADQSNLRGERRKKQVAVYSLAVDPMRPYSFITGGGDHFVRLYDMRMAANPSPGQAASGCIKQYAPSHMMSSLRPFMQPPHRAHSISGVAFARGCSELIASYVGEHIYSFDVITHARDQISSHTSVSQCSTPAHQSVPSRQAIRRQQVPVQASSRAAQGPASLDPAEATPASHPRQADDASDLPQDIRPTQLAMEEAQMVSQHPPATQATQSQAGPLSPEHRAPAHEPLRRSVSGSVPAPSYHSFGAQLEPLRPPAEPPHAAASSAQQRHRPPAAPPSINQQAVSAQVEAMHPLRRSPRLRSAGAGVPMPDAGTSVRGETALAPVPASGTQGQAAAAQGGSGAARLGKRKERDHAGAAGVSGDGPSHRGRGRMQTQQGPAPSPAPHEENVYAEESIAGAMSSAAAAMRRPARESVSQAVRGHRESTPSMAASTRNLQESSVEHRAEAARSQAAPPPVWGQALSSAEAEAQPQSSSHGQAASASNAAPPDRSARKLSHPHDTAPPLDDQPTTSTTGAIASDDPIPDSSGPVTQRPLPQPRSARPAASVGPARQTSNDERAQEEPDGPDHSNIGMLVEGSTGEEEGGQEGNADGLFRCTYSGHCNGSTFRKVAVMGRDGELVVSGSDDGRMFIWEQATGKLVNMLVADRTSSMCAVPHPVLPCLASAGTEGIVRIWTPEAEAQTTLEGAETIMRRNAAELAEVPALREVGRPILINMHNFATAAMAAASAGRGRMPVLARAAMEAGTNREAGDNEHGNAMLRCTIM